MSVCDLAGGCAGLPAGRPARGWVAIEAHGRGAVRVGRVRARVRERRPQGLHSGRRAVLGRRERPRVRPRPIAALRDARLRRWRWPGLRGAWAAALAVADYEKACTAGTGLGCALLGAMYLRGHGVDPDLEKALRYGERAR